MARNTEKDHLNETKKKSNRDNRVREGKEDDLLWVLR